MTPGTIPAELMCCMPPPLHASFADAPAAVPEPATAALLAAVVLALLLVRARRWRRA